MSQDGGDGDGSPDSAPGRQRTWSPPVRWFLVDGRRSVIAAGVVAVVFVAFVALELTGLVSLTTQPFFTLYGALITGNLTLITIVLSINQLVLSRELGSVPELQTRIEGTADYRDRVARGLDADEAPILPADFLRTLFRDSHEQARQLGASVRASDDRGLRSDVREFVDTLTDRLSRAEEALSRDGTDLVDALSRSMDLDFSLRSHRARQLRATHADSLASDQRDAIDRLIRDFQHINLAQQYFKTLYVQVELAFLSKALLYVGVPVEIAATMVVVAFSAVTAPPIDPTVEFWFRATLSVVTAALFAPLAVLFAYVIRVATISRRTAPTSPFTVSVAFDQSARDSAGGSGSDGR